MAAMAIMWTETWQLLRCFIFSILESTGPLARDFGYTVAVPAALAEPLLGVCLVAMGQVPPMGQVQSHDAVVDIAQGSEDLKIRRRAAEGLHIDAPPQRKSAAENLLSQRWWCSLKPTELSVPTCSNGSTPMIWSPRARVLPPPSSWKRGESATQMSAPPIIRLYSGLIHHQGRIKRWFWGAVNFVRWIPWPHEYHNFFSPELNGKSAGNLCIILCSITFDGKNHVKTM